MEIKVNVGDPKSKKTFTLTISEEDSKSVYGKSIGDTIRGELVGKAGYEFLITGGSDNAGFPMRNDVSGSGRRKILITRSTGNQKSPRGIRVRKTVSGRMVNEWTSQLNCKVTKHGKEPLEEKPAEAPETPKEEKAPEPEKKEVVKEEPKEASKKKPENKPKKKPKKTPKKKPKEEPDKK